MKSKFLALLLICTTANAECDFASGVKKVPEGYLYSVECHLKVGGLVEDSRQYEERISKLNKAIELKDLALVKTEERVELWKDTTFRLEDRVNAAERWGQTNNALYFIGGVLFTGFCVWSTGQLR